jgi:hypothetical protein
MVKYVASALSRTLLNPASWLRFLPAMNNAKIALGNEGQDPENKMLHDLCDLLAICFSDLKANRTSHATFYSLDISNATTPNLYTYNSRI